MTEKLFVDSFPAHFFVEMYYNRGKKNGGFIYEEKLDHSHFTQLCESYGVFNGCEEITKEIMDIVDCMLKNNVENFKTKINNSTFIENVEIKLTNSSSSAFYSDSQIKNGKYNPLRLRIGIATSKRNIISSIMHELLHAYENQQRCVNNAPSMGKAARTIGYDKNPINKTPSYNIIKQNISYVLYHLTDFERNAYIAQIKGELEACDKAFWDIKDAFEYIKTTVPYRNYQTIFSFCSELCGIENNKAQKDILKYVSELSNYNFKTYDDFRNWLNMKMKKYQRKFNNILPKIAAEYLTLSESFNPSMNYLI